VVTGAKGNALFRGTGEKTTTTKFVLKRALLIQDRKRAFGSAPTEGKRSYGEEECAHNHFRVGGGGDQKG